jgi:hypothetical protein
LARPQNVCTTTLIEGVAAEAAGRSIPELEAARDDAIMRIIAGRGEVGDARG